MNWPRPIRVIGCGSPQGDDAAGWEVVRQLRNHEWPDHVVLLTIEGGHQLLDVLDGRGSLVLIDAVQSGDAPGTVHRLDWPNEQLVQLRPGSTHQMRPAEALELAATLGMLPQRVIVWGIEAAEFGALSGLSLPVAVAVPKLARLMAEELADAQSVTLVAHGTVYRT